MNAYSISRFKKKRSNRDLVHSGNCTGDGRDGLMGSVRFIPGLPVADGGTQ